MVALSIAAALQAEALERGSLTWSPAVAAPRASAPRAAAPCRPAPGLELPTSTPVSVRSTLLEVTSPLLTRKALAAFKTGEPAWIVVGDRSRGAPWSTGSSFSEHKQDRSRCAPWSTGSSSSENEQVCSPSATTSAGPSSEHGGDFEDRSLSATTSAGPSSEHGGDLEEEDRHPLWSSGSPISEHEQGRCRPCAFVNTEAGCGKGDSCRFCHLEHVAAKWRLRPCKGKRLRIRRSCERLKHKVDEYMASGRPALGLMDYLLSLELPSMIEGTEVVKKSFFTQMLIHVEETYGVRLVESF